MRNDRGIFVHKESSRIFYQETPDKSVLIYTPVYSSIKKKGPERPFFNQIQSLKTKESASLRR